MTLNLALDTLPIQNLAKIHDYHLVTFLRPCPEVVAIFNTYCTLGGEETELLRCRMTMPFFGLSRPIFIEGGAGQRNCSAGGRPPHSLYSIDGESFGPHLSSSGSAEVKAEADILLTPFHQESLSLNTCTQYGM